MITTSKKGTLEDFQKNNIADKDFHFTLIKRNSNSSIIKSDGQPISYVGSHRIKCYDIITDKKDGKVTSRTIRYIPGEQSIYMDMQSPDKDVPKKLYAVEIVNGRKLVSGNNDPLLLEWMMKTNWNASNPNRRQTVKPIFELVDTTKAINKVMENTKAEAEALSFAFSASWDEVYAYARVLNVNLDQSPEEIRYALSVIAKRSPYNPDGPEKFLEGKNSAAMKRKYNVLKAVDGGFLVINTANNSIALANNPHEPIYTALMGKDVVDGLVNLLSTEKGLLIYDAIIDFNQPQQEMAELNLPTRESMESAKADVKPKVAVLQDLEESDAELIDMVRHAKEKEVVTFVLPMWYKYRGDSFKGEEGFLNGLKSNPAMYKSFKYDLSKIQ